MNDDGKRETFPITHTPHPEALVGEHVGNYEVIGILGSGGMGVVYHARHPRIGREVSLKVLHTGLADNEKVARRFENEARAVNAIGHPGIVEIFDFGHLDDGRAYFVMEYLAGRTLFEQLSATGAMPMRSVLHVARQVVDALGAAHQIGIVHRDLKSDNIFVVDGDGGELPEVKVLDFGIAKLRPEMKGERQTEDDIIFGTPQYMAPEQVKTELDVDGRADLYALGIVMFEMLTGSVPFTGDHIDVLVKHVSEPAPLLHELHPDIPRPLGELVDRCLRKDPDKRYRTAEDLAYAIDGLMDQSAVEQVRGVTVGGAARSADLDQRPRFTTGVATGEVRAAETVAIDLPRKRRWLAPVLAVAAVATLAAAGLVAFSGGVPGLMGGGEGTGLAGDGAASADTAAPVPAGDAVEGEAETDDADAADTDVEARVTLRVESEPASAEVLDAITGERMGTTPWELTLDRGAEPPAIRVTARGYVPVDVRLSSERSDTSVVKLDKIVAAKPKKRPKPKPKKKPVFRALE